MNLCMTFLTKCLNLAEDTLVTRRAGPRRLKCWSPVLTVVFMDVVIVVAVDESSRDRLVRLRECRNRLRSFDWKKWKWWFKRIFWMSIIYSDCCTWSKYGLLFEMCSIYIKSPNLRWICDYHQIWIFFSQSKALENCKIRQKWVVYELGI